MRFNPSYLYFYSFGFQGTKRINLTWHSLDDIQDSTPLRRGQPAAHTLFGVGQAINSASFQYVRALQHVKYLDTSALHIFIGILPWAYSLTRRALTLNQTKFIHSMLGKEMSCIGPTTVKFHLWKSTWQWLTEVSSSLECSLACHAKHRILIRYRNFRTVSNVQPSYAK